MLTTKQKPFTLNYTDLFHFILFAILSTPPNYMWQAFLEGQFPGYIPSSQSTKKTDDKADSNANAETRLSKRNTAIKFALDQTIGAAVNTVLFLGGIALLRGHGLDTCMQQCKDQFWPLIFAGQKLWPAVSLLSFTLIPLEYRTTFGGMVGLFWGAWLSMMSSSDKKS